MKIALFSDSYFPYQSGVATSIRTLQNELIKKGHDVFVVTACDNKNMDPTTITLPGIYAPFWNVSVLNPFSKKSLEYLYTFEFDIIHTHSEFLVGVLANQLAKANNIPRVHTAHTFYKHYYHYAAKNAFNIGMFVESLMVKGFCNNVDRLIVPSTEFYDDLNGRFQITTPTDIIKTGIDLSRFYKANEQDRTDIRKKYNIDDNDFVLLYIGRLATEKNLKMLLDAQAVLTRFIPNIKLMMVGTGNIEKELKKHTKKLGIDNSVIFTGVVSQSEIQKYYQAGDIFVSASHSETQGLTLVEAAASQMPIVCYNYSVYDDVVTPGENGFMFDSADEYISQIMFLYNHPEILEEFKLNSLEKSEDFSKEKFADSVESVYMKIKKD